MRILEILQDSIAIAIVDDEIAYAQSNVKFNVQKGVHTFSTLIQLYATELRPPFAFLFCVPFFFKRIILGNFIKIKLRKYRELRIKQYFSVASSSLENSGILI